VAGIGPCVSVTRFNVFIRCDAGACAGSRWVPVLSTHPPRPHGSLPRFRLQTSLRFCCSALRISSDSAQVRHICDVILIRDM
jgi:hypothetical protein